MDPLFLTRPLPSAEPYRARVWFAMFVHPHQPLRW
jgi:hypothetical protein